MSRSKFVALILSAIIAVQPCINVLAEDNIEENFVEIETMEDIESYGFEENIYTEHEIFEDEDGYDTNENISINVIENETEIINDTEPHDFYEIVDETNANDMETEPVSNIENTLDDGENFEEEFIIEEIATEPNTPVLASASNVADGYYIGTLTAPVQTDTSGKVYVGIDNIYYEVGDDVDLGKCVDIVLNSTGGIVYSVYNGIIDKIYASQDIMSVTTKVTTDPQKIIYQNGKLNTYSFNLVVKIYNSLNVEYEFLPAKIKNQLKVYLTNIKIDAVGSDLNFGKEGFWIFANDVTQINEDLYQEISCLGSVTYSYQVNINSKYSINTANAFLGLNIAATTEFGRTTNSASVSVGNLDYQEQQAEAQKATTTYGKSAKSANSSVKKSANNNVTFDAYLNNYLSSQQIQICKEYTYTYAGTLISSTSSEQNSSDKIMDKVFSKLGIDKNLLTSVHKLVGTTNIQFGNIKVKIIVDMGSYNLGTSSAYASFGKISYSVYKNNVFVQSGTGAITYTDMKTFINDLKSIAESYIKSAYNGIWGNDANKIANYLTEGTIIETLRNQGIVGEFSDSLFKVITTPTKRYTEACIECPVDVQVYDLSGNLCGVITNNIIDTSYHDVYMRVDDDKKYVYLSGDDYYLKLVGNDTGTMDYYINEYNSDGSLVRTISYNAVALNNGKIYYATTPDAGGYSSEVYDLIDSSGNVTEATSDTRGHESQETALASGSCGDNAYWVLYNNGLLYVYGEGAMYSNLISKAWDDYRKKVNTVIINDGITTIGGYAFDFGDNVSEVAIPDSVTSIGERAFSYCDRLGEISLPKNLKSIGRCAFEGINDLKSISIPECVTSIGERAFRDCDGIISITIPSAVTMIGDSAFAECNNLESIIVDDLNQKFKSFDGVLYTKNQSKLICYPGAKRNKYYSLPENVTEMAKGAFEGNSYIEEVELNNVINIPYSAFRECSELISVPLNNIHSVGEEAFYNCTNLREIVFSDNLRNIEQAVFAGCESITNVVIPDGISVIGWAMFSRCSSLTNIKIPSSVKTFGNSTFSGTNLKTAGPFGGNFDYEYGWSDSIPAWSFADTSIESIVIPKGISNIGSYAFYRCNNLKDVFFEGSESSWKAITISSNNTCLTNATIHYGSDDEVSPNPTCKHNFINVIDREVTCDKNGVQHQECTLCGIKKTTTLISATGHMYKSWEITEESSALKEGLQTRTCSICGKSDTKAIAKLKPTIKLTASSIILKTNQSTTKIKVSGLAKGDAVKSWKSSNTKIVKVSNKGKITAQSKKGKATITVTLKSGLSKKITVKVQKSVVACTKITLNKSSVSLKKGKTFTLKATVKPITCVQKIKYSSSNKKVATVSSKGKITAKKKGKATITVTVGKKKVKCKVTVK